MTYSGGVHFYDNLDINYSVTLVSIQIVYTLRFFFQHGLCAMLLFIYLFATVVFANRPFCVFALSSVMTCDIYCRLFLLLLLYLLPLCVLDGYV